jgi:hypothetical protein
MSAVGRTLTITMLGDTKDLEAALERSGIVANDSSKEIQKAAAAAGSAAAEQAKAMGLSADQQEAAAARAASAYIDGQKHISAAQAAAATSAAETAKAAGLSADEQVDAAGRAAAAYVEGQKHITAAMGAASAAAASAAKSAGMTADEQVAAADRAVAAQRAIASAAEASAAAQEVAAAKAAEVAKKAADAQEAAAARASSRHESVLSIGKYAGGAAVVTAGFSVKGAIDLQKDMELVHTEAGATQAQVDKLTGGVLKMAPAVATGPGALAAGMYHVVSSLNSTLPAASRAGTELHVLRIAAEGAKTGGADLVDVTNALDAAVVSGISGVHNYGQAMGALNATVGAGDMSMQDLADAYGKGVAVMAKLAGVSITQLGGALAVLGDNNIRGAAAGTLMSSTLRIMKAPSEAAAGALKLVGINSTQLADDMRSGGLIEALEDLKTHMDASGATASQQGIILTRAFGGRQSTGVSILLSQLDRLRDKTAQVGDGAKNFGANYQATTQTMAFKTQELEATIEKLGDQFGLFLIPKLEDVADETEKVIGYFEKHTTAAEVLAGVIGGVLGLAVATYAGDKALKFITATRDMGSGLMIMSGKATAAATSIGVKFGLMSGEAETAAATMSEADGEIVAGAETAAAGVDTALGATGVGLVLVGLGAAAVELHDHWSEVMSGMETEVNVMVEGAEDALNGLISALNAAISAFNDTIGLISGDIGKVGKVSVGGVFNTGAGADKDAVGGLDLSPSALKASKAGKVSRFSGIEKATAAQLEADLTAAGLSKAGAAGLIGNFAQESTVNPSMNVKGKGIGLASWTNTRAAGEQAYAKAKNLPWNSLTAQVGFILHELQGHTALLKLLQTTGNASAAAKAVALQYEDPAPSTANYSGREKWAEEVDAAFGGDSAAMGAPGGSRTGSPTAAATQQLTGLQQKLQKQLNDLGKTYSGSDAAKEKAAATSAIPAAVVAMLATARSLIGTQYTHGGGHGSTFDPVAVLKKIGVDCSGFVSAVLHGGGVSLPGPLTTTGLAADLQKGKGSDGVTVYDRAGVSQAHTIIDILGKYFESGGNSKYNPSGGVSELTKAQAAGELSGGGFEAYHPILPKGPDASDKALSEAGISAGALQADQDADIQNVVATYLAKERAAIEKALAALATKGDALLSKYESATQNGSVASLGKALGLNTSTGIEAPLLARATGRSGGTPAQQWAAEQKLYSESPEAAAAKYKAVTRNRKATPEQQWNALQGLYNADHSGVATPRSASSVLTSESDKLGRNATEAQIQRRLLPTLTKATEGSAAQAKYRDTVENLTSGAASAAGLNRKQSATVTRDVMNGMKLPADLASKIAAAHVGGLIKIADKLTAAHKASMDALADNVYAANVTALAAQTENAASQEKDRTTLAHDYAAAELTVTEAVSQKVADAMGAAATQITDATQKISDQFAGIASAIQDATQGMSDASDAAVTAINDNSQTKVDILGERGLYGLNLIAQQEKVQLDVMKAGFDQQIAVAQANVDATKAQWDATVAADQLNVDQVQIAEDALSAQAQQNLDTVTIAQDSRIATATAHADSVALANDIAVQLAQTAVTLSASGTKAQQNLANAKLAAASGAQDKANADAQGNLSNVTDAAASAIATASAAYTQAQGKATIAIASANQQLTIAQGQGAVAEAAAAEALTGVTDAASLAEAGLQDTINETSEAASTQFAGTGTVVNVYGVPAENAAAVGDAVDWVARTQLQLAS